MGSGVNALPEQFKLLPDLDFHSYKIVPFRYDGDLLAKLIIKDRGDFIECLCFRRLRGAAILESFESGDFDSSAKRGDAVLVIQSVFCLCLVKNGFMAVVPGVEKTVLVRNVVERVELRVERLHRKLRFIQCRGNSCCRTRIAVR